MDSNIREISQLRGIPWFSLESKTHGLSHNGPHPTTTSKFALFAIRGKGANTWTRDSYGLRDDRSRSDRPEKVVGTTQGEEV